MLSMERFEKRFLNVFRIKIVICASSEQSGTCLYVIKSCCWKKEEQ